MRIRLALALLLLASPAVAWEFTPSPICTLTDNAGTTVTYDATLPEYTISLTRPEGTWPTAPVFVMAFDGPRPLTIQTPRHVLSDDGRTLTVTDSGFGNVLDGMEFNRTALALAGDTVLQIPLDGIGPAMQAFRACPEASLS